MCCTPGQARVEPIVSYVYELGSRRGDDEMQNVSRTSGVIMMECSLLRQHTSEVCVRVINITWTL